MSPMFRSAPTVRIARLALFGALITALAHVPAPAAQSSRPAPPLTATLLDGRQFSTVANAGKVIVINFWATWCAPCREEMPAIDRFYRRYRDRGLEIVAISLDDAADAEKVRDVMRQYAFPAAIGAQSRYSGLGRIWRIPMTFVIDREGRLREDVTAKLLQVDEAFLEQRVAPLIGP
jgi:cytochrome c biogenesis protein CcmG, thiol:disulfide interchange protein DsbE